MSVRFSFVYDGYTIDSMEAMRENFYPTYMIEKVRGGRLTEWLEDRGFSEEAARIEAVKNKESVEIVREMVSIFNIEGGESAVQKWVQQEKIYHDMLDDYCRKHKKEDWLLHTNLKELSMRVRAKGIITDPKRLYDDLEGLSEE
jgi:hypothetical protein